MASLTSVDRNRRLANEYHALCKMPINDLYKWAVAPGQKPPYVSSYIVTYTNPYPVKSGRGIRREKEITLRFDLPVDYPRGVPTAKILKGEIPFLTNVYQSGNFCYGDMYKSTLWLWKWFNMVGQLLAGDPQYTNTSSAANGEAATYYSSHRKEFPVGRIDFPRPKGF